MGKAALRLYRLLGLPGAALIFLLEGLGVPIPVEIPLVMVGQRITQGLNSYWQIVGVMWLTTVVGNMVGYLIGYYGGRPLVRKLVSWFRVTPDAWARVEHWFQRHGMTVVVATRWINWGFAQNMWLSGITRVPFGQFFLVMVINNFLWAMAWTWLSHQALAYLGRRSGHFLHHSAMRIGVVALAVILVGLGAFWLVRRLRKVKIQGQQ
ncbi:MAG: associated Golgi protein-related protein [Firmicutes bacterium]|nr:associated Golgi protein-related protein [Bacillota bacterium]